MLCVDMVRMIWKGKMLCTCWHGPNCVEGKNALCWHSSNDLAGKNALCWHSSNDLAGENALCWHSLSDLAAKNALCWHSSSDREGKMLFVDIVRVIWQGRHSSSDRAGKFKTKIKNWSRIAFAVALQYVLHNCIASSVAYQYATHNCHHVLCNFSCIAVCSPVPIISRYDNLCFEFDKMRSLSVQYKKSMSDY